MLLAQVKPFQVALQADWRNSWQVSNQSSSGWETYFFSAAIRPVRLPNCNPFVTIFCSTTASN